MYNFFDLNDDDVLVAEFRELISRLAIPKIILHLSDRKSHVRRASADILAKLSEQGRASKFLT